MYGTEEIGLDVAALPPCQSRKSQDNTAAVRVVNECEMANKSQKRDSM